MFENNLEKENKKIKRDEKNLSSQTSPLLRHDFSIIASMINDGDYVLDLGCAEGNLLENLREQKNARVRGIEKKQECIEAVLKKKIAVFNGDILQGLNLYSDNTFDVAILSQTVQELVAPDLIIAKMLKKAKRGIVSFLNYGYYKNRWHILMKGQKPITYASPLSWPFHKEMKPLSLKDFEKYAQFKGYRVVDKYFLDGDWKKEVRFLPNLTCGVAIFLLEDSSVI